MVNTSKNLDIVSKDLSESAATHSLQEQRRQRRQKRIKQEDQFPPMLLDILGWVAILFSIAWLLILISFDPNDPSSLNINDNKLAPENLLGPVGANIAAFCYQILGFGNYLFPLCAIYIGFLCIRSKAVNDWFFQLIGMGLFALVVITFLGSLPTVELRGRSLMTGGLVGIGLWRFFTGYLNPFGTYLFLFGLAGLALIISTHFRLADVGVWFVRCCGFLGGRIGLTLRSVANKREKSSQGKMRQRILERELNKMEDEKKQRLKKKFRNLTAPIEDEASEVETEELGDASMLPEPDEEVPPPEEGGGIRVNQMKPVTRATQEAFPFVKELEGSWIYPTSYFFEAPSEDQKIDEQELLQKAKALETKFAEFSVTGQMKEIFPGPVVTTYEFKPDAGIKYSRIVSLSDDLCLALGAESIRIDRMPGKSSVGIEVPNNKRELITFREMIESENFQNNKSKLLLSLGKTIDGSPFSADLAKMPHLLIAGQTGSGKSVGINAMVCSILMRTRPDETKLILIDPKMVEMGIYADIPHLLTPVVTDPNEAANALKWAVTEMERRYKLLASYNFRNLEHYNRAVKSGKSEAREGDEPLLPLPCIIVIIDELADLMMVARGEVEESIARLAQKSRAIGIHLILATQRPSVDIITGVIKSNLPSRLAYRVAQKNDSRIILDANGAEKLLGKGDGLFLGPGTSRQVRIHAPYLSESEVLDLVKFLRNQGKPSYDLKVVKVAEGDKDGGVSSGGKAKKGAKADPMYEKAARLVVRSGQASVSYLQRKLSLGYARAAKLVDMMEEDGIVGPNLGSKARDILVKGDFFDEIDNRE